MKGVILLATALAGLAVAEALYYAVRYAGERKRAELRRRLRAARDEGATRLLRERRVAHSVALERFLRALPFTQRMERLLLQTDLDWTVASFLGFGVAGIATVAAALIALFGFHPVLVLSIAPLGFGAPFAIALLARARRGSLLSMQLPEALDMMVRSLRAGHGINAAFKLVATEMPVPIAVEFARCFEETNIGVEFRDAVKNMTERVPGNLDLKIFAVSVVLQHETGGNLVELLEQISHTIRERYKFYGKLGALTAEGKVSGTILGALPFFTTAVIAIGNTEYLAVLLTDSMGHYFIATGLAMWLMGVSWLFRLAKVDY